MDRHRWPDATGGTKRAARLGAAAPSHGPPSTPLSRRRDPTLPKREARRRDPTCEEPTCEESAWLAPTAARVLTGGARAAAPTAAPVSACETRQALSFFGRDEHDGARVRSWRTRAEPRSRRDRAEIAPECSPCPFDLAARDHGARPNPTPSFRTACDRRAHSYQWANLLWPDCPPHQADCHPHRTACDRRAHSYRWATRAVGTRAAWAVE